jgi:ABC-type sugar transport system substrate-binding protein
LQLLERDPDVKLVFLYLILLTSTVSWAQKVTFINPGKSDESYWVAATNSMKLASSSLDMKYEVIYAERNHFNAIDIARQLALRPKESRPDYVIFTNDYGVAPAILKILNDANINCFMAYSGATAIERNQIGLPRQRYKHWIGSLEPQAEYGGYITARALIDRGRMLKLMSADNKIHIVAIAGDRSTNSSILRNEGLQLAIREAKDVVLDQVVYADWSESLASEKATWLYQRYPNAKLIWSGNDLMAFGAIQAFEAQGEIPGKTVLFSGINTSKRALEALQSGKLSSLAGGHFFTGAWAIVMIHDYAHGKDFANQGLELTIPMFTLFTPEKAKIFLNRFGDSPKPIDFKKYSKVYNPNITNYQFGFEGFLR